MIITHLSIRNFLGITELNLTDCQQRMLVIGKNWSGKTSVLDAIRAVFLGEVRDASAKNLDVADWIHKSAKQASVTVGFTEAGETFEARLRVQGKGTSLEISRQGKPTITGSPKEVRNALWAILQANPAHRAAGLNPRLYLSGGDIGQMISDLGGGGVDLAALAEVLGDNADWFHGFATVQGLTTDTTDGLLSVGAAAFRQRTELKARAEEVGRRLEGMGELSAPIGKGGVTLTPEQIPVVESALAQMRQQRDGLLAERGAAQTVAVTPDNSAAVSERAGIDLVARVADSERLRSEADALIRPRESATQDHQQAKSKHSAAQYADHLAEQKVTAAQKAVKNPPALDGECPVCRTEITSAVQAHVVKHLEGQLKEAELERKKTSKAQEAADKAWKDADSSASLAERQLAAAQSRCAALDATINAVPAAAPEHRALADIEADIEAVDRRIANATTAMETLKAIRERDRLAQDLDALNAEIDCLNWAIPLFHSDRKSNHATALSALSKNEQADFLERCNAKLEPFGVRIGVRDEAKRVGVVYGALGDSLMLPVRRISGAESLLVEWAIAAAFAGDGLVLLDEINRADGGVKSTLLGGLAGAGCGVWAAGAYTQTVAPDVDKLRTALAPVGLVWMERP
jgi:hypothetical protein